MILLKTIFQSWLIFYIRIIHAHSATRLNSGLQMLCTLGSLHTSCGSANAQTPVSACDNVKRLATTQTIDAVLIVAPCLPGERCDMMHELVIEFLREYFVFVIRKLSS